MKTIAQLSLAIALVAAVAACGDKKDSAEKQAEAQKAIQEGMQKERSMMEGMVKGVETVEKKAAEAKEETKK
ncbi:MAG TPA: hypothetical protein VFK25_09730 [Candidatus Binatia bacterium]|nr:hypothetical protein [Candidatus Binatia bacterium]